MIYYILFNAEDKFRSFGSVEHKWQLSNNHRKEWFDTENELEDRVDDLMGKGYFKEHWNKDAA